LNQIVYLSSICYGLLDGYFPFMLQGNLILHFTFSFMQAIIYGLLFEICVGILKKLNALISPTKIICSYFLHLYQQYTITSSCKASPSYYYVQIISLLEHPITHLPTLLVMLSGAKIKSIHLSIIAYIVSTKLFSFNYYGINNYIWMMMMALAMFNTYSFMNPWFICCCAQAFSMERSRENQCLYSTRKKLLIRLL